MAKMYFKYGTMNSGKSMDLLKVQHNYQSLGERVLVLSPSVDTRYGVGKITSRAGMSTEAVSISDDTNLLDLLHEHQKSGDISCILVDEVQFLSKKKIKELKDIVLYEDIPVIGYGLKLDFQGNLFEGSEAMLIYSESIEEIKTKCYYCKHKATFNLRLNKNGYAVAQGEVVEIGGNEQYIPVCHYHYKMAFIGGK